MSDFKFTCPSCAQRLRIAERHAGRQILCPKCQHLIVIPAPPSQSVLHDSGLDVNTGATLSPWNTLAPSSKAKPPSEQP